MLFGMILMAAILLTYYGIFSSTTPTSVLEDTATYDYTQELKGPVLKRGISNENTDLNDEKYYDELESDPSATEESKKYIHRRAVNKTEDLKPPSPAAASPSPLPSIQSPRHYTSSGPTESPKPPNSSNPTEKGKPMPAKGPTTPEPNESGPDVRYSNAFLNAVFEKADGANMTHPLGLCRKNADFKMADYKAPLFPADSASDVLRCINQVLEEQMKHQLCIHLDPEMTAYLRWLILTGEPREKHRPVKAGLDDDFLFPSTPCASDSPDLHTPECLVGRPHHEGLHF